MPACKELSSSTDKGTRLSLGVNVLVVRGQDYGYKATVHVKHNEYSAVCANHNKGRARCIKSFDDAIIKKATVGSIVRIIFYYEILN